MTLGAKLKISGTGLAVTGILLMSFLFVAGVEAAPDIRVGVSAGWGDDDLIEILNAQQGIKAFKIPGFSMNALEDCDVLMVTQRSSAIAVTRAAVMIKQWVEAGGGVLFMHGAVGHKSHIPIFDTIGAGGEVLEPEKLKPAKEHPVTAGLDRRRFFTPSSDYNYVSLKVGPSGCALAVSEDGDAALAAGEFGEGRVVLNGIGAGAAGYHFDEHDPLSPEQITDFRRPEGEELKLLLNSVRWLGFKEG